MPSSAMMPQLWAMPSLLRSLHPMSAARQPVCGEDFASNTGCCVTPSTSLQRFWLGQDSGLRAVMICLLGISQTARKTSLVAVK